MRTTFRSLSVRNYRLFATGQLVKLIGVWMMFIAQDWLVLHLSGDSATALGWVTALQFAPILVFTLFGGQLADRYDKRKLLIVANSIWTSLSLVFALLVLTGVIQLWQVFVFAGLLGVANAVETPVRQSFVSEIVGMSLLPNALSLSAATFNSARIIGPAIAGVAIAVIGTGPVFVIAALASAGTVFGLLRMRAAELHRDLLPRDERAAAKISDGIRYVVHRSDLLVTIAVCAAVGLLGFNFQITLAVLAKTVFHTGAASFGLFSTAVAVGALSGALAGSHRKGRPSVYIVLGAAMAFGVLETLVGLAPSFWLVVALLVPTGFFMMFYAQASNQRVQLGVDAAFRGRVMALYILVFFGTTPLGAPIAGWVAQQFGAGASIWLGGVGSFLAATVAMVWQLRRSGQTLRVRVRPMPKVYVVAAHTRA